MAKKVKIKTTANSSSVSAYLNAIEPAETRKEAKQLAKLFKQVSGTKPRMWFAVTEDRPMAEWAPKVPAEGQSYSPEAYSVYQWSNKEHRAGPHARGESDGEGEVQR